MTTNNILSTDKAYRIANALCATLDINCCAGVVDSYTVALCGSDISIRLEQCKAIPAHLLLTYKYQSIEVYSRVGYELTSNEIVTSIMAMLDAIAIVRKGQHEEAHR